MAQNMVVALHQITVFEIFSLLWQNYVLRIEVIVCSIQIGIQSASFIMFIVKLISVLTQPGHWK